jgi:hypothetical protein
MSRIKVGVVGCGLIGQMMHLPHLKELHELYELVALCDVSPGTLRYVGDYYGVGRRHADYRELLKEPVDAVVVLAPTPRPVIVTPCGREARLTEADATRSGGGSHPGFTGRRDRSRPTHEAL